MLKDYHLIRDKNTSDYYIHPNKVTTTLCQFKNNPNFYKKMKDRKPIESFFQANDSRFDSIQKSPKVLTNVRKVTGLDFDGYEKRGALFKTGDIARFYNANKEATMKKLHTGALPWKRMTKRMAASQVITETPEDCYDYAKAIEVKTTTTKPRSIALTDFEK